MGAIWCKWTGNWMYQFEYRHVRHQKRGFATKKEAAAAEAEHRKTLKVNHAFAGQVTYGEAVQGYFKEQSPRWAPATADKYRYTLCDLTCQWDHRPLRSLTTTDIFEWCAKRRESGELTGATVNRDLAAFSAFFAWCLRPPRRWVSSNIASRDEIPRHAEPQIIRQTITPMARKEIAPITGPEMGKVDVMHSTGKRRGVIVNLRWEQVDLENRVFQYRSKGQDHTSVLGPRAVAILRELGPRKRGPVFA